MRPIIWNPSTYDILVLILVSVMIFSDIVSCFIQPNNDNNVLDNIHYSDLLNNLNLSKLDVDGLSDYDILSVSVVVSAVAISFS